MRYPLAELEHYRLRPRCLWGGRAAFMFLALTSLVSFIYVLEGYIKLAEVDPKWDALCWYRKYITTKS